jgi:hypothetical protein
MSPLISGRACVGGKATLPQFQNIEERNTPRQEGKSNLIVILRRTVLGAERTPKLTLQVLECNTRVPPISILR